MIYKKEKLDTMFTEYLKISLLHSYKIHQNLQPPPLDFGAPPKGPAPPCMPKISQPPPNGKFPKITSPPCSQGGRNYAFFEYFSIFGDFDVFVQNLAILKKF